MAFLDSAVRAAIPWSVVGQPPLPIAQILAGGGWEALVKSQSMNGLIGFQETPRPPQVVQSSAELTDYQQRLAKTKQVIDLLSSTLNSEIPRDTEAIISNVEIAMTRIYKVAVAVRGDFKPTLDEDAPVRTLLKGAKTTFDFVEAVAKQSLDKIAKTQATISDMDTNELNVLKQELSQLAEQTKIRINGLAEQARNQQSTIDTLVRTQEQNIQAANELQRKMEGARTQNQAINVGKWFLGPLGALAVTGADELIIKSRQNYEELMRQVQQAQQTIGQQQQQLMSVVRQKAEFETQRDAQQFVLNQIPAISNDVAAVETQSTLFQKSMLALQETATKLGRQVMQILVPVNTTQELAYTKEEFVRGLMQTCDTALFHVRLTDECKMVVDELTSGYGPKALPADVKAIVDNINTKLRTLQ